MRTAVVVMVSAACLFTFCAGSADAAEALYRFAILSDRTGGHTPGVYARVIDEMRLLNPDFVVTVGDHIEGYGEDYERSDAEWDSLLTMLRSFEVPVYMTPGNHDIWDDESEAMYRARTGHAPYYSFDYENTHFVVLDNSRYESSADLPDEQRDWLIADLSAHAEAENIFVFFHKPLWAQTLALGESDPLHDIFIGYGVDAVFNGHLHHYFSADYDGIDYTVMGSSGGVLYRDIEQPVARGEFFQFGWVTVTPAGYELAVIDLGGIYPRDVVTSADLEEIQAVEREFIQVGAIRVFDNASAHAPVEVIVENATDRVMDDVLTWDVPDGWAVEPAEAIVVIDPGETKTLTFMMQNDGELYPSPRMSCRYPLSNGRELEVDLPARIVRSATAKMIGGPPAVDGDPSDEAWKGCTPVRSLHAPYVETVEGDTEFSFACDGDNLYLSAVCYDPLMADATAVVEERDGAVYSDDCVGYFFQPDPDSMIVYQIYVNPLGTIFDQKITFDETMWYTTHREWDGEYEVATQHMDDRWNVEIAIPLEQIGGDIEANSTWRVNFRRKQERTRAAADWQVPIDYNPGTFGELSFE